MIHKSAIIDKSAKLDSNVNVGPFSIIGPEVEIESGTSIGSHVVIEGPTTIGKNNKFFLFPVLEEIHRTKNIMMKKLF